MVGSWIAGKRYFLNWTARQRSRLDNGFTGSGFHGTPEGVTQGFTRTAQEALQSVGDRIFSCRGLMGAKRINGDTSQIKGSYRAILVDKQGLLPPMFGRAIIYPKILSSVC